MVTVSDAHRHAGYMVPVCAIATAVAVADLWVKWGVTMWLGSDSESNDAWLVHEYIGFEYARNSGAAFGLFRGHPELLALISVIVAIGFYWLIRSEVHGNGARIMSAGLLAGGAVGNLIERMRHGYVTDFIAVGPWPRFNLADSAISIGVIIFVLAIIYQSESPEADEGDTSTTQANHIGKPEESEKNHAVR